MNWKDKKFLDMVISGDIRLVEGVKIMAHTELVYIITRAPLFTRDYIVRHKDRGADVRLRPMDIKEIIEWPDYEEPEALKNLETIKLALNSKLDFLYLQICCFTIKGIIRIFHGVDQYLSAKCSGNAVSL